MGRNIRIHPFPQDPVLEGLADQLLGRGAVLSQIISGVIRFQDAGRAHPHAAPIPDVARSLIAETLGRSSAGIHAGM